MDLKQFVSRLKEAGDLLRIRRKVSPRHEMAAILEQVDRNTGRAVLFERVRGYASPVIGNLFSRRRRLALALGVDERALLKEYARRSKRRLKPRIVEGAPVTQTVLRKPDILREIPVLTHREKDAGPYFSCAVTMARDPETGASGMGIYRIQVRSGNEVSLNFQNPPLTSFLQKAEAMGKELEVAIVLGMDPLSFVASVFPSPPQTDRFEIAGGLRGEPVELVACSSVDVLVPADAQFVLEGRIRPGVQVREGPFGESWGTYQEGRNPVARIDALMRRKKPIYQALLSHSGEEPTLMGLAIEATLADSLRAEHPGIASVAIDRFDRGRLIVGIRKRSDAEPRRLLKRILSSVPVIKIAVVVDEDIDVNDPYAIGFAMATRLQAKRGVLVIDEARSSNLDPSAIARKAGRFGSKLGLDATLPLGAPKARFEMAQTPQKMRQRAKQYA